MSSVQSFIKQQNIIYGSANPQVTLYTFTADAATVPAVGSFAAVSVLMDISGTVTPIFRDMGEVIVSDARTFRRIQMLTNSPATYGVAGQPSTTLAETDYRTYFAEMSMINGQGVISNLYQIRG